MRAFLDGLPDVADVLDLGCGPGNAAAYMAARGHRVEAWDASPEMVALARERHGLPARVAQFRDLSGTSRYDGVYANFSLLHAPKTDMPGYLARIAAALRPNGRLHLGMKTGTGERRDVLGRFYAFYTEDDLNELLGDAGLTTTYRRTGQDAGLDGTVAPWIILQALKHD